MGYYMRYITSDERGVPLEQVGVVFKSRDSKYELTRSQFDFEDVIDVFYADTAIGQIEINGPSDEIFEDELNTFREIIGDPASNEERSVLALLDSARYMVVVEAVWQGTDAEHVLEKFDPLWVWLFANRNGILQADNEGFYDSNGLVVERKFML